MGKYMVLYRSTATAAEQMAAGSPEQMKAAMDLWTQWGAKAGDAIVDFGAPLSEASVIPAGSDNGETHIGGYAILEADSVDAVNTLLEGHPHFHSPGASIEVLEFLPMPGSGG